MLLTSSMLGTCVAILLVCTAAFAQGRAGVFDIRDYGAEPDTAALNTPAIARAIEACAGAGGGTVLVPAGRFVTGPIELRGHVELQLAPGAVLAGSPDISHYAADGRPRGLIYAADAEHVAVTGPGTVDGNGTAFMIADTPKRLEHTTGQHTRQGDRYRVQAADGPMQMRERPGSLIHFRRCRNVLVRDVLLADAPTWTLHIDDCDVAGVRGVRIDNNLLIPNNDGIHCVTSRNVSISDCHVRAGDDAIAITGLHGRTGMMAENITVANCTLLSRSAGVRVGYGSNSIRRCTFQNLVIHDSNRGLGVFVRDEGSVTDILFDNIVIQTRLHTGWWGNGEPIHVSCLPQKPSTKIGRIENVRFSNIVAHSEHGVVIWGHERRAVRDLSLADVRLRITESPLNADYGGNFDLRPAAEDRYSVFAHDIPGVYARGVDGITIRNLGLEWGAGLSPLFSHGIECEDFAGLLIDGFTGRQAPPAPQSSAIALRQGRRATIRDCTAADGTKTFLTHHDVEDLTLPAGNDVRRAQRADGS